MGIWGPKLYDDDVAQDIKESGLCMEEYFNVEGGDYAQSAQ